MRTVFSPRWLAIALLAVLIAAGTRPAHAAPLQQTVSISVVAFVDVSPPTDPNCPGCDGQFDAADADFAATTPLGTMTFIVNDGTGTELARQDTTELSVGIQRTLFTVPEGTDFDVTLDAAPSGWVLCKNETATRHLTSDDFQLGNAREEYHFTTSCSAGVETETPAPTSETPGVPTSPANPTPKPTGVPGSNQAKSEAQLGSIKGIAFIDLNGDGKLDPNDPGLNDVLVHLDGGGLQLTQLTPGNGTYSFDGLGAGKYDVYITPGPEWRVTTKRIYSGVSVAPGQVVMGIDFGLVRVGQAMPAPKPVKVIAGASVRLPATGITELPAAPILGLATLLLGALGALGMSAERRKNRL